MNPRDPRMFRALAALAARGGNGYAPEAYLVVLDSVMRAISRPDRTSREHVSAADVSEAVADMMQEKYGPFAMSVLDSWNVHSTLDFGKIVFELIRARLLVQSEDDTLSGFEGVFDFKERFLDIYDGKPPYPDMPRIRF